MITRGFRSKQNLRTVLYRTVQTSVVFFLIANSSHEYLCAQAAGQQSLLEQVQKLSSAMARTQAQMEESQRELSEMHEQLIALERQLGDHKSVESAPASSSSQNAFPSESKSAADMAAAVDDLRERQDMQASQIATHEQIKVESESKYPVKLTGLILLSGFVNTSAVDVPATPALALSGSGSTGASVRQSVLGIDARGPHLFGASSYADLRVDFDGSEQNNSGIGNYSGYSVANTLLRLRTAHAGLQWSHTRAYFSLDRPIFSPDTPTSLTAVSLPPLAWSGNLWTWNPQVGIERNIRVFKSSEASFDAALIDASDAPLTPTALPPIAGVGAQSEAPSAAEQSRWPGVEAHFALLRSSLGDAGNRIGIGGYFAPHHTVFGKSFDAWAGTLDANLHLPMNFQLTAAAYRGLALGGLGGGTYKDFVYRVDPESGEYYSRPLDDVGGWVQLKEKFNERMEANAAFGIDNSFAGELRRYAILGTAPYLNLARNRTYTGNIIYSPSAYLLFSLEYRRLISTPVMGLSENANVISLGAGYKF